jgi:hypothetical protein
MQEIMTSCSRVVTEGCREMGQKWIEIYGVQITYIQFIDVWNVRDKEIKVSIDIFLKELGGNEKFF